MHNALHNISKSYISYICTIFMIAINDNPNENNGLLPWYAPKRVTLPKHSKYLFQGVAGLNLDCTKSYIRLSKVIDFTTSVRAPIQGLCEASIPIYPHRKRMSETMKWSLIAVACDYGATDLEFKQRLELFSSVIKVQSYLYGFKAPALSLSYFLTLWRKFKNTMRKDPTKLFDTYFCRAGQGWKTWVDQMMEKYPKLLHGLYRYATGILTCSANTCSIVACMKRRAKILYPDCPIRGNLKLSKYHFWEWFHKCGGILKRQTSKHRLTPEQRKQRVIWALQMKLRLAREDPKHICFMDEKWFYTTSRRKKSKFYLVPNLKLKTRPLFQSLNSVTKGMP